MLSGLETSPVIGRPSTGLFHASPSRSLFGSSSASARPSRCLGMRGWYKLVRGLVSDTFEDYRSDLIEGSVMKIRTFSQREAERAGKKAQATSTSFPPHLRRLLAVIITETLGLYYTGMIGIGQDEVDTTDLWSAYERLLYREIPGYANYADRVRERDLSSRVRSFIFSGSDADVLDVVDITVAFIDNAVRHYQRRQSTSHLQYCQVKMVPDDALQEIDIRLREAGTIYRVIDGSVIKSTDDFSHDAAVVPALTALGEKGFENALQEFHEALAGYRDGKYDIVLQKANHAFESTMKVIAGKKGWAYEQTATAKKMLDVMVRNGLVPSMRDSALKALATLLESDLPMLRNKMPSAGHGAGESQDGIPESVAAYAVNIAAANIRLLVESYHAKEPRR